MPNFDREISKRMRGRIEHDGIIDAIDGTKIQVRIVSESACSACHAKGACSAADLQEKLIDIKTTDRPFRIGQKVTIVGNESQGFKAVLLAYILPTAIIVATLLLAYIIWGNDILAGIASLGAAIIYFSVLYIFRKRLTLSFSFQIK